jgi:hypothetical protein
MTREFTIKYQAQPLRAVIHYLRQDTHEKVADDAILNTSFDKKGDYASSTYQLANPDLTNSGWQLASGQNPNISGNWQADDSFHDDSNGVKTKDINVYYQPTEKQSAFSNGKVAGEDYKTTYQNHNAKYEQNQTLTRDVAVGYVEPDHLVLIDPKDPNHNLQSNQQNPGTTGDLSIDYASILDFGANLISTTERTWSAKPDLLLDNSQLVERVNHLQISDFRHLRDGWTIGMKLAQPFQDKTGKILPGATLTLEQLDAISTADKDPNPDITLPSLLTLNNQNQQLGSVNKDHDQWGRSAIRLGKVNVYTPEEVPGTYQAEVSYSLDMKPISK